MTAWFFTKKRKADRFQVDGVPVAQGVTHRLKVPHRTTLEALHMAEGLYAWKIHDTVLLDGYTQRVYLHGFDATPALMAFADQIKLFVKRLSPTDETSEAGLSNILKMVYSQKGTTTQHDYERMVIQCLYNLSRINTVRDRNNQTPRLIHQAANAAKLGIKLYISTLDYELTPPDFNKLLDSYLVDHMASVGCQS